MKLQGKIFLLSSTAAVLLGGPLLWTVRQTVHNILLDEVKQRGLLAVEQISERAAPQFQSASETALLPMLQAAQDETGALFVQAIDSSGRVLAHTNVAEKGKVYANKDTQGDLQERSPRAHLALYKGSPIMEATSPVLLRSKPVLSEDFILSGGRESSSEKYLGFVELGLPLGRELATEYRLFRRIAVIVFLAGGTGILLFFFFMRHMLRPVLWLSEATARIARGEHGRSVPVASNDELGALAEDFNRMTRVLAETTVSKRVLEEAEGRVRLLLDSTAEGIYGSDLEGHCTFANQACARLLGYKSAEELVAKPIHQLIHHSRADGTPLPDVQCKAFQAFREGRGVHVDDEVFWRADGTSFPVEYWSYPIFQDGKAMGAVISFLDSTERRKMEAIVRQSDKMSAVGQLAAGVAHEINNPLGVILGFAQASLRRITPGETLEMPLKSIEKEAIRCKNLVQDLLTFSRVSKLEREPMDLNRTIEVALSLVNAQARVSNVEVRRQLAPDLPRLLGNTNQIQQVIVNLANNAFDAMTGQGILTVSTGSLQEGPLSWITLTVTDTGPGIAPEILSRIFDPFFTTKPVGKGTGLGLSLIHEIVTKHSGTIDVKSGPGCTQFCIKFPVRMEQRSAGHVS